MNRENDIFYIFIILIDLMAIMVRANENLAIYEALKVAQSTWNRPCYLYGQRIDCSVLRNLYIIPYPTTRFDARFFTPRNNFSVPIATVLHYDVNSNKHEHPQKVPFQYKYQPPQVISESVLRELNVYKSSPPPAVATSSGSDTSLQIKNTMTLSDFKQTTNTIYLNRYPVTKPAVSEQYDEITTTPYVTTTEHQNEKFVYSSTYENISISNDVLSRRIFLQPGSGLLTRNEMLFLSFKNSLDRLERKFFLSAFTKLTAISPEDRRENGISFLQSGLFLHLLLVTLSTEMDKNVTQEIEECLGLNMTEADKTDMIKLVVSWLPESSDVLKFRWTSRLTLGPATEASREFQEGAAAALPLRLNWLNGSETSAEITKYLNDMVEADSGGAMHNTFEEEELSSGVCGVALGTLYMRGRWRAAPTLLNDSRLFRDAEGAPLRYTRLFRINDIVGYAYLHEWDAEAIEISYATPGLTLLMLVPKEPTLRKLVEKVTGAGLERVLAVMHQLRAAVTLPLYTLRMTLLLPNKLEDMEIPSLLSTNETDCHTLKLSHAVQRLMFWAEAGRNAFKDDGIEWDPRPEMEIVVDRPYLFFVRWHNITLMNGNFVL